MWNSYVKALSTRPLRTKIATGMCLACASDLAAQASEINDESARHGTARQWDARRTFGFAVFGASYMGGFQHFLFGYYARRWPVTGTKSMRVKAAVITTAAHFLVSYPFIYFPTFFLINDVVGRGCTVEEARTHLYRDFVSTYFVGLVCWTPAMLVQFLYVPLKLQVPWVATCSFIWTTFLSFQTNKK